ncbi:MAG TPA: acetyl ornithine aminotransferase family protein [Armatimonadota bacterium]|jgi:4-aminobutyrate aminotransferase
METPNRKPRIVTDVPGPRAQEVIARDARFTSPSYTRDYPIVAASGKGCWLTDEDGNEFLDFTAGIAVCSTGHCHPKVVEAIQAQASRLLHMSGTDFWYAPMANLAERLAATTAWGVDDTRVFFTNSGTESVEAAFKLARFATGRKRMIAFQGAFHGRTFGSLSLTGSKISQLRGFTPLVPGVQHVPYGYCYRCAYNLKYPSCALHCVTTLDDSLFASTCPPDEVAAIIVEPIQGEGGYVIPPPGYLEALRELTRRHGILLIVDEVQSGFGRTGKMWAYEHTDAVPDMITSAKGIASGMPLGALLTRKDLMNWPPGSHATTFGGNPVSCAAALATLDLLQDGGLIENAATVGEHLIGRLRDVQQRHPCIGDVRGQGLMAAIELIDAPSSADRAPVPSAAPPLARELFPGRNAERRDRIVHAAFSKGLLLLGCGRNAIRFCPPLVVSKGEVDTALDILSECLDETA